MGNTGSNNMVNSGFGYYVIKTAKTKHVREENYLITKRLYYTYYPFAIDSVGENWGVPTEEWRNDNKILHPDYLIEQGLNLTNNHQKYQESINKYNKASNILNQYTNIEDYDSNATRTKIDNAKIYTWTCWGNELRGINHNYQEALIKYQKALDINLNYAHAKEGKAICLANLGDILLNQKDNQGAVVMYEHGLNVINNMSNQYAQDLRYDFFKKKACALNAQGRTEYIAGRYVQALEKYIQAIELDPNEKVYYANKAATLNSFNRYNEAIEEADNALQLDKYYQPAKNEKIFALNAQGSNFLIQNNYQEALDRCNAVLELYPNHLNALNTKFIATNMIEGINLQAEGDLLCRQSNIFNQNLINYQSALVKYIEALEKFTQVTKLDQKFYAHKNNVQISIDNTKELLIATEKTIINNNNINLYIIDQSINDNHLQEHQVSTTGDFCSYTDQDLTDNTSNNL